jgi:hypothetical protein
VLQGIACFVLILASEALRGRLGACGQQPGAAGPCGDAQA